MDPFLKNLNTDLQKSTLLLRKKWFLFLLNKSKMHEYREEDLSIWQKSRCCSTSTLVCTWSTVYLSSVTMMMTSRFVDTHLNGARGWCCPATRLLRKCIWFHFRKMTDGADCFCHIWPEIFSTSSLPAAVIEQISSLSNHQQCLQDIWWSIDLDWGIYWVDLMLHFLDPISHKYDRSDWYFDSVL